MPPHSLHSQCIFGYRSTWPAADPAGNQRLPPEFPMRQQKTPQPRFLSERIVWKVSLTCNLQLQVLPVIKNRRALRFQIKTKRPQCRQRQRYPIKRPYRARGRDSVTRQEYKNKGKDFSGNNEQVSGRSTDPRTARHSQQPEKYRHWKEACPRVA